MNTFYEFQQRKPNFMVSVSFWTLSHNTLVKYSKWTYCYLIMGWSGLCRSNKGSLIPKRTWFLAIENLILHFWPEFSILECFILKIWILAHFFNLEKCAKIQIFKIKYSRIENSGQKWRMRFFYGQKSITFRD